MREPASPSHSDQPVAGGAFPSQTAGLPRPLTSFVGRECEIEAVTGLVTTDAVRLLTLTGPGGAGKTRLAIQVTSCLADDAFPDGIHFVSLSETREATSVQTAVARALGVHQQRGSTRDAIVGELGSDRCLLVLDNFEQVLEAATFVANILASCPGTTVLVTSRAILDIAGEHVFEVPPLALPALTDDTSDSAVGMSDAVRLFLRRMHERGLHLDLDATSSKQLAEICIQLDGLPLAIELAVPWLRMLSPGELLTRLNRRLPLLDSGPRDAPDRQRTMRAAIGWSHALLNPEEQALFRRCAVFVGGFPIDAVEIVTGIDKADETLMEQLAHLVDHSLLRKMPVVPGHSETTPARLVFMETIREYAWEQLVRAGEDVETRNRHAAWCLSIAENAVRARIEMGSVMSDRPDRLGAERHNARAACEWLEDQGDIAAAMTLAFTLWPLWLEHGELREGSAQLKRLLRHPDASVHAELAARAKVVLGQLEQAQGEMVEAEQVTRESLPVLEALTDDRSLGVAFTTLGLVELVHGDYHEAARLLERSLASFRAVGDLRAGSWSLRHLSSVALGQGDIDGYERLARQGLDVVGEDGAPLDLARLGSNLAQAAVIRGNLSEAASQFEVALARYRRAHDHWGEADVLHRLGVIAYLMDQPTRAHDLFTQSERLFRKIGDPEGMCRVLTGSGWLARYIGDLDTAARRFDEAISLARAHDARDSLTKALIGRGVICLDSGNATDAALLWRECLDLLITLDDRLTRIALLEWIAHLGLDGHAKPAIHLLGACAALRHATGTRMDGPTEAECEALARNLRLETGDGAFRAAYSAGEHAAHDHIVRIAETLLELAGTAPSSSPAHVNPQSDERGHPLTHRELEIVRLLVAGMTDGHMAEELGISRRTVASHISHIYVKIGVSSRAAAAAWAVRHNVA